MHRIRIIAALLVTALACGLVGAPSSLLAQQDGQQKAAPESGEGPAQASTPAVPGDERLTMLIYSTLIALNQANASGNYSVFRDISAPGFQVANSPTKLAQIFADLRNRNFDLSPILLMQPKLTRKPAITQAGLLRLTGFFPTRPERVIFDLIYQSIDGQWRLFGIAADTAPIQSGSPAEPQASPAPAPPRSGAVEPAPERKPAAQAAPRRKSSGLPDVRDRVKNLEAGGGP